MCAVLRRSVAVPPPTELRVQGGVADRCAVASTTACLERLGHKKVIVRCDDGNSMLDFLRAIKQRASLKVTIQTLPKGSHTITGVGEQVRGRRPLDGDQLGAEGAIQYLERAVRTCRRQDAAHAQRSSCGRNIAGQCTARNEHEDDAAPPPTRQPDSDQELWESPQLLFNPTRTGPVLCKEARGKEINQLVGLLAFECVSSDQCSDGRWITSRGGGDCSKADGTG